MKNYYINRDYLVLKLTFKEINKFFINFTTQVLYVFIIIIHMILKLTYLCFNKRFKSVNFSLIINAFIFLL